MADNVEASAGSGGATFATDEIAGVHFPRTKLIIGADGANDGDVSSANPLPVTGTVAVTNGGLTELAAAINSSRVDVNIAAQAAAVTVDGSGVTQPVSGTVAVTNAGLTELAAAINASSQMDVNIAASGATVPVSNAGLTELAAAINASSQMDVNIAASGATVPVSHAALTELAAAIDTEMQVDVVGALPAGNNNIGDVDVASIAAGDNNIGNVDIVTVPADPFGANADAASATGSISAKLRFIAATGIPITGTVTVGSHAVTNAGTFAVQPGPATSGGLLISRDIDLDNSTLTVVKNSAGQVYGWSITNRTTAAVYVKFYNATSGTLGTGTPVITLAIPGNSTDHTMLAQAFAMGIEFSTGICVGAGTGVADADNTDPGANGVVANIFYK